MAWRSSQHGGSGWEEVSRAGVNHHRGCAFPSQAHSSAARLARHSFPFRGAHSQVHRGSDRWRDSGGGVSGVGRGEGWSLACLV